MFDGRRISYGYAYDLFLGMSSGPAFVKLRFRIEIFRLFVYDINW